MGRKLVAYAAFGFATLGFYANGAWRGWWVGTAAGLSRAFNDGGSGGGHGYGGFGGGGGFRGGK